MRPNGGFLMLKLLTGGARDLVRNPVGIFILTVAFYFIAVFLMNYSNADLAKPVPKTISGLASAILTAGTFGMIFQYMQKRDLIHEAVKLSSGQFRAIQLGIIDVKLFASDIDSRNIINSSKKLIIGTRYSASLFDRNRDEFRNRLRSKKSLTIIMMNDSSIFPKNKEIIRTPENFLKELASYGEKVGESARIIKIDDPIVYNFVWCDTGIWIKLYFSSRQPNTPPAFFVENDSSIYKSFVNDIELMMKNGMIIDV